MKERGLEPERLLLVEGRNFDEPFVSLFDMRPGEPNLSKDSVTAAPNKRLQRTRLSVS